MHSIVVSSSTAESRSADLGPGITSPQVSDDDSALELRECLEAEHTLRALFLEGGIWSDACTGTLTHAVSQHIRGKTIFASAGVAGRSSQLVAMGVPDCQEGPRITAKRFYEHFKGFLDSHFPQYETGQLFGLFELSSAATLEVRTVMLKALCRRHNKPFDVVRLLFFGIGASIGGGSLWTRAQYHKERLRLEDGRKKEGSLPERPQVVDTALQATPLKKRMNVRGPFAANARAWLHVLRDLAGHIEKPDVLCAVELIEMYVSRLASTGSIERWFGHVARLELKQRAHKMAPDMLDASLKLRIQDLGGVMEAGQKFVPKSLLVSTKPHKVGLQSVEWPATDYAKVCQRVYGDLYGSRRYECRNMARATGRPKIKKVKLKLSGPVSSTSIRAHKEKHDAAVAVAVAASASVPDFAKAGQAVQQVESSMDEHAKKRKQEEEAKLIKSKLSRLVGGAKKDKKERAKHDKKEKPAAKRKGAEEGEPSAKKSRFEQQRDIAAVRLDAHVRSTPGAPVEYVGSRGERFRVPPAADTKTKKVIASTAKPRAVYFDCGAPSVLPPGLIHTSDLSKADAVMVNDMFQSDGPAGVYARVLGLRILDASGADVKFNGVKKSLNKVIKYYCTPSFCSEYPRHVPLLKHAFKTAGCKFKKKPFEAKKLKKDTVIFLVGSAEPIAPQCFRFAGFVEVLSAGLQQCL